MLKEIEKSSLIDEIIKKTLILVKENDDMYEENDDVYINEYRYQLENRIHNEYLRVYVGYMIENGSKTAIEIMKLIIKYNLSRARV